MKKQEANNNNEDRRLLLWISFAGFLTSAISLPINYILDFGYYLILITWSGIIIYGTLTIAIYKGLNISLSQHLIVYITLIFTNLLWYFEHSDEGPILSFFVIIFTLIVFIWQDTKLVIGSLVLVVNIFVCFYIDYYYPDFVAGFKDEKTRTVDIYTSLFMFGIVMYALMYAVKRSYAREYKKALQSDRLKTSFLENISHEIRTPLNAIIGFSELIMDNKLSQDQRDEYISLINSSNESLLRIIDDVLQVSLLETDQVSSEIKDCEVNKLLNELFKTYSRALIKNEKAKINLQINESNRNIVIKTDKARLQQILINLLDNAIKYTHSGNINFGYQIENNTLLFHVSDTGIGIKNKYQDNVFDRFYKVEENNNKLYSGTGIGLFLAKKAVESLDGKIWVESNYGIGTSFYFTIPKTGYHEIEPESEKIKVPEKKYILKGKKILVVEDQASSQIYFKSILNKSGVKVLQARNGLEGIEFVKEHTDIDLVLMDIRLPIYNGYDALEEIRKFDKHIPIIAQTAFGMKQDEEACIEAGFNDFISKPIKTDLLLEKIWNALEAV